LYVGTPAGSATVWFNVATGTQGTQQNSGVGSVISATITNVGGSWYKCTVTGVFSSVTSASGVFVTQVSGDASNTRNVGGTAFVWGAQLTLASTLDQSYQKVTDWTTEVYAWNATKNVPWLRRNMLYVTDLVDGTAVGSATVTNNYTYLSTVCAKCDFPANSSGATNRVNFSSWRNDQVPFVNGVTYVGSI
jgi:hypothetical protein